MVVLSRRSRYQFPGGKKEITNERLPMEREDFPDDTDEFLATISNE
jgi:hypothetical protein